MTHLRSCSGATATIRPHTQRLACIVFLAAVMLAPSAYALPSYARQTGQQCAACHVGGNWPQLTPWGRFFKLSGYSAGKSFIDKEGFEYVPLSGLVRTGLTWAAEPKNSQGQTVIQHNGDAEFYNAFGTLGTKITNWSGVFAEYGVNNTFPGWKGVEGPVDIRAAHFLHLGNHELLVGFDTNNAPTVQDVWNTIPAWSYPFYGSPQAPGAPAAPVITSLPNAVGHAANLAAPCVSVRRKEADVGEEHVAREIATRLGRIFLPDQNGRRPCFDGDERFASDPHWQGLLWFNEYFHADTGRGLGASHQTGWTALITRCMGIAGRISE